MKLGSALALSALVASLHAPSASAQTLRREPPYRTGGSHRYLFHDAFGGSVDGGGTARHETGGLTAFASAAGESPVPVTGGVGLLSSGDDGIGVGASAALSEAHVNDAFAVSESGRYEISATFGDLVAEAAATQTEPPFPQSNGASVTAAVGATALVCRGPGNCLYGLGDTSSVTVACSRGNSCAPFDGTVAVTIDVLLPPGTTGQILVSATLGASAYASGGGTSSSNASATVRSISVTRVE